MADDKLPAAIREAEEALALGHTDCVVCCHAVEQEALAEQKRLRGLRAPRRLAGYSDIHCDDCKAVVRLEVALRALLAATAPAAGKREEKGPRCPFCDTARIERDARLDLWVCHVCKRSWAVAEEPAHPPRPALDAVREAKAAAEAAPELNPLNYTHDEVCELNAAMTRVALLLRGVAPNPDAVGEAAERLAVAEARLERIDAFAGERCEASGCRPDPCGPVEYHDVEGVPLCAECWQECVDDAAIDAAKGPK